MEKRFMCRDCYKLYTPEQAKEMNYRCCNADADSYYMAEIDEPIAKDIAKLNKKGYITDYCCAGHYDPSIKARTPFYVGFRIDAKHISSILEIVIDSLIYNVITSNENFETKYLVRLYPDRELNYFLDNLKEYDEEYYNKFQLWRDKIYRLAFHGWVNLLPDISNE